MPFRSGRTAGRCATPIPVRFLAFRRCAQALCWVEVKAYPLQFEKPVLELERQLAELRQKASTQQIDLNTEIEAMERKLEKTRQEIYVNLSAWERVQISRHPKRPYFLDYIQRIFEGFLELHGDRKFGDDRAIIGGFACLAHNGSRRRLMLVGHQKGRDTKENLLRNFGMPHPEGYRKALRLMKLAEKVGEPVVSFIDTPGAYPGVQAEQRHIAEAIAVNLREMALLEVPVLAIVIGEGGSGGALGIGLADRVLMLENAYYSVISPEGCAAILWKDRAHAPKAAEALKMGAHDLLGHKLVDEIVEEPPGGAHRDHDAAARHLKQAIVKHLSALEKISTGNLLNSRYDRYRSIGEFRES